MTPLLPLIVELVVNVTMALLLIAVMVYCNRLNKNIRTLQESKGEMAKLFAEFDASIGQATQSVQDLQEATQKAEVVLKDKLDKANLVADDLTFMIERGIKMADQLEGGMKKPAGTPAQAAKPAAPAITARAPQAPTAPAAAARPAAAPAAPAPAADAKKNWPLGGKTMSRSEAAPVNVNQNRTASIESVLEQMANRNNAPADAAKAGDAKKNNNRIRSKAEQELFDSLKSGR